MGVRRTVGGYWVAQCALKQHFCWAQVQTCSILHASDSGSRGRPLATERTLHQVCLSVLHTPIALAPSPLATQSTPSPTDSAESPANVVRREDAYRSPAQRGAQSWCDCGGKMIWVRGQWVGGAVPHPGVVAGCWREAHASKRGRRAGCWTCRCASARIRAAGPHTRPPNPQRAQHTTGLQYTSSPHLWQAHTTGARRRRQAGQSQAHPGRGAPRRPSHWVCAAAVDAVVPGLAGRGWTGDKMS